MQRKIWIKQNIKKESNVAVYHVATFECNCTDFDTICDGANVSRVRRKYLAHYISVQSMIMPPTHTADVLVGGHCVVVKANTVLVMTSGRF